jgi:uncharacterized protein YdaU (DUF1376 family)
MYAGDWLKSRSVRFMQDYQRGWYIQLLAEAWDGKPQCMLPNDDAKLQMLAGISDLSRSQPDFNDRWNDVKRMFNEDGAYVYNERQIEELAQQQHRREIAVKAGNASAKKRQERKTELQRIKRQHIAESNGRSTGVEIPLNINPTLQTPDCILQSSSSTEKRHARKSDKKKRVRVEANTDLMIRIGAWFGRRETTLWTVAEAEALEAVSPQPDELQELKRYYTAEIDKKNDYRRRDIITLLNNWNGELDRARRWKQSEPVRNCI